MTPLSYQELIDQELADTREHQHLAQHYTPRGDGLTHCQRVLKLLADHKPHSHLELYALVFLENDRRGHSFDLEPGGYVHWTYIEEKLATRLWTTHALALLFNSIISERVRLRQEAA